MELPKYYSERFNTKSLLPRNEREEIVQKFLDRLNSSRAQVGLKAITPARMQTLFQGIPTEHLYPFYRDCEQGRNFSSLFWYRMTPKAGDKLPK